ncbi:DUF6825 family protein [Anthocerotibacter panamensis]|uniref:DUF6825 family protein n=1 Tax=Anthocerotibacter panamensis TaxID=2857077 RepID=UPI001C403527|nr:hypothetical protein [Anthocerotibacter panamensis]
MTDPLVRAFFIGRAAADLLFEKLEDGLTDALSEAGKFESEQREKLRVFTEAILERAAQQERRAGEDLSDAVRTAQVDATMSGNRQTTARETDLQEVVDTLRAEVAQLRSELQRYRANT